MVDREEQYWNIRTYEYNILAATDACKCRQHKLGSCCDLCVSHKLEATNHGTYLERLAVNSFDNYKLVHKLYFVINSYTRTIQKYLHNGKSVLKVDRLIQIYCFSISFCPSIEVNNSIPFQYIHLHIVYAYSNTCINECFIINMYIIGSVIYISYDNSHSLLVHKSGKNK